MVKNLKKIFLMVVVVSTFFLAACAQSINFTLISLPVEYSSETLVTNQMLKTSEEFANFVNSDNFTKNQDYDEKIKKYDASYFEKNIILAVVYEYEAVIKTVKISENAIIVTIKDKYLNKARPDIYINNYVYIELALADTKSATQLEIKFV